MQTVITQPQRIAAAWTRVPLKYTDEHAVYLIIMDDDTYYCSAKPPAIYDASGMPSTLACELGAGTLVRLEVEGVIMRSVQVLELCVASPFSGVPR